MAFSEHAEAEGIQPYDDFWVNATQPDHPAVLQTVHTDFTADINLEATPSRFLWVEANRGARGKIYLLLKGDKGDTGVPYTIEGQMKLDVQARLIKADTIDIARVTVWG